MIIPKTKILIIQIDKKIIFSHHIGIIHKIKTQNKTINVAHLNITDNLNINQLQSTVETQSDPPGIDNKDSLEIQLNHINCESTNDESETEKNSFNKTYFKLKMNTRHQSKRVFIKKNKNFNNFENSRNTQNITGYTAQELKGRSSTNKI